MSAAIEQVGNHNAPPNFSCFLTVLIFECTDVMFADDSAIKKPQVHRRLYVFFLMISNSLFPAYVGNLDEAVSEEMLWELMIQVTGTLTS